MSLVILEAWISTNDCFTDIVRYSLQIILTNPARLCAQTLRPLLVYISPGVQYISPSCIMSTRSLKPLKVKRAFLASFSKVARVPGMSPVVSSPLKTPNIRKLNSIWRGSPVTALR